MKQYDSYKDSGVEWIGMIPSHWEVMPLKRYGRFNKGLSCTKADLVEEGCPVVSYGQVHSKNNKGTQLNKELIRFVPESIANSTNSIVRRGDFIFADTSEDLEGSGNVVYNDTDTIVFGGYHTVLYQTNNDDNKYLAYLFTTDDWRSQIRSRVGGVKVYSITQYILGLSSLLLPPIEEQRAIANYLDAKTAKIDGIIASREKKIKLLEELRASIISEAVTKGIHKNVEMKDSGIQWIGRIPKHWEVCKTLYVLSMPITDGPHETPVLYEDGIPFISAEAVSTGEIRFDLMRGYISQKYYEECCKKYTPQMYDIYMIKSGATTGRIAMVKTDRVFTIWSPLAVFRANERIILHDFLYYALKSDYYQRQVELYWSFGTQQNIGMRSLERIKIAFPSIQEQKDILNYLKEKVSQIDKKIEMSLREISLLKEYRNSLITEVVTGKRKVVV